MFEIGSQAGYFFRTESQTLNSHQTAGNDLPPYGSVCRGFMYRGRTRLESADVDGSTSSDGNVFVERLRPTRLQAPSGCTFPFEVLVYILVRVLNLSSYVACL